MSIHLEAGGATGPHNGDRVVALIDARKRSLVASGSLPDRDYIPDMVIGRAPDGSVMSLWQRDRNRSQAGQGSQSQAPSRDNSNPAT